MFWTGINGTELLGRMFKATGCLAAVAIMLISSGCTGAGQIRKSRLVKPKAPETAVADAVAETSAPAADSTEGAPVAQATSTTTGDEVAQILSEKRGAVFASLSIPAGAGPPASTVKQDEDGAQESVIAQTGDSEVSAESPESSPPAEEAVDDSEAEPASEVAEEPPAITEEVAEANVAEAVPEPVEEAPPPAEEPAEEAEEEAEVARVESPPESVSAPVAEGPPAEETLTSNNPGQSSGGSGSSTASVLFLVLGGIGAALILIRKRVAA